MLKANSPAMTNHELVGYDKRIKIKNAEPTWVKVTLNVGDDRNRKP